VIVNGMGDVTKATAGIASDRRARAKYCFIIEHDEIKAKVENEVLFDS
jgi:4-hydroxy-3-methylbut-2-en-1-yl diphosphate synthase IspG/GcpE